MRLKMVRHFQRMIRGVLFHQQYEKSITISHIHLDYHHIILNRNRRREICTRLKDIDTHNN